MSLYWVYQDITLAALVYSSSLFWLKIDIESIFRTDQNIIFIIW